MRSFQGRKDVTWKYNIGFLLAFKGDINGALEEYKTIQYKYLHPASLVDVEIFISEVIKEYPEKIQLIFFRGLINFKVKSDYKLAKEDFSLFIEKDESKKYDKLVELAEKYLDQCRRHLGL